MRHLFKFLLFTFISINLLCLPVEPKIPDKESLSEDEITILRICEGVINLFRQYTDEIWPGYDLAEQPFIVYVPKNWVLFFNVDEKIEGFTPYPKEWPDLGTKVLYHEGQYKNLVGQLVFDFQIGGYKTIAIGLPEKLPESMDYVEMRLFGHIVHEAFHQFQIENFGEIQWQREEKYPILDPENTALSYLEMRLLMDALQETFEGNKNEVEEYIRQFVAVRNYRWDHSDPFIPQYEQGQEIREGTARYVEMKCVELLKALNYKSSFSGIIRSLKEDFNSISQLDYMKTDFTERMTEESVSPEDMIRNRIYPLGSAMGFLLDNLDIDWKQKAQKAGSEVLFERLFSENLGMKESQLPEFLKKAKENYDYDRILFSTERLIQEYRNGYEQELQSFESQKGVRVEIVFDYNSIFRSRSSRAKRWTMDKGSISLCNLYSVYTLKNENLELQLHDSGVYEEDDWDSKRKKVVFFADEISSIVLDNKTIEFMDGLSTEFSNIEIDGKEFKFVYRDKGKINISSRKIKINLIQKE